MCRRAALHHGFLDDLVHGLHGSFHSQVERRLAGIVYTPEGC